MVRRCYDEDLPSSFLTLPFYLPVVLSGNRLGGRQRTAGRLSWNWHTAARSGSVANTRGQHSWLSFGLSFFLSASS